MREYESNVGRGFRFRFLAAAIATSATFLVGLAPASADAAETPLIPPGFRLRASNGYTLSVTAFGNPRTERGAVILILRSHHAGVLYSAPASVSSTSIDADLGALGRIDVDFVSSGQSRVERPACGDPVRVDSGRYEGNIAFEGEEGYSQVQARSARGEAKMALSVICAGGPDSEGSGGHSPGARLAVRHRGARRFEFTAMKNSPTRPARFAASISESRRSLQISRSVEVEAAPSSFDFDIPSGAAHVSPPGPFAGEAHYVRLPSKSASWRGDLSVDFPGRANVQLTGPGTRASLSRAVLNPSHPF